MATASSNSPLRHKIEADLMAQGFTLTRAHLIDQEVTVAHKKIFRWSWFATQVHFYVILGEAPEVSAQTIALFSSVALNHALENKKGLPRGFQTGLVAFGCLISPKIHADAKAWLQLPPRKHFAAFEMPVVVDAKTHETFYYPKTPLWGMVYYRAFRQFIAQTLKG